MCVSPLLDMYMFYVIAKIYIFIAFIALSKRKKMFHATLATKEKHTRKHLYNFFEIWITGVECFNREKFFNITTPERKNFSSSTSTSSTRWTLACIISDRLILSIHFALVFERRRKRIAYVCQLKDESLVSLWLYFERSFWETLSLRLPKMVNKFGHSRFERDEHCKKESPVLK